MFFFECVSPTHFQHLRIQYVQRFEISNTLVVHKRELDTERLQPNHETIHHTCLIPRMNTMTNAVHRISSFSLR